MNINVSSKFPAKSTMLPNSVKSFIKTVFEPSVICKIMVQNHFTRCEKNSLLLKLLLNSLIIIYRNKMFKKKKLKNNPTENFRSNLTSVRLRKSIIRSDVRYDRKNCVFLRIAIKLGFYIIVVVKNFFFTNLFYVRSNF